MTTAVSDPAVPAARIRRIALVGNANVGKTTLFNRLTGLRQRTGNYPGVTVERKLGTAALGDGASAAIIDLPGTYTLAARSRDERIVLDVLLGRVRGSDRPDAILCVADATNLLRNLFLVSQVAELGLPVVVALNMIDEARTRGVRIDAAKLSERLGVAVVPVSAATGEGIDELRRRVRLACEAPAGFRNAAWPPAVASALEELGREVSGRSGRRMSAAEIQRLLFDADSSVLDHVADRGAATQRIESARRAIRAAGLDPQMIEATHRFADLRARLEGVVAGADGAALEFRGHGMDAVLTHRVWGLVIFVMLVLGVFWTIYAAARPVMDAIDGGFNRVGEVVGRQLAGTPMMQSLVVDGVIAGVGGVLVFLPQILTLFFFIAILEDSGYMARAAYLMDRLFAWCGLNGKSFVPLLSSFACAVPGVLSTRTIDNPRARLTTILIAPLMSCSARLPVYLLLIGAVVEPRYGPTAAALALLGFHLIGLCVAMPIAAVVNRVLMKTRRAPFVLEMPPYRRPIARDVLLRMWDRSKDFLSTAGTVIVAVSILIWALSYFPHDPRLRQRTAAEFARRAAVERHESPEQVMRAMDRGEFAPQLDAQVSAVQLERSYLGRIGRAVQPIFAPAGFDWRMSIGVIASFPARELFVSTMGITLNLGKTDPENRGVLEAMRDATGPDGRPSFNLPVALSVAVFFALCMQCVATLSVIGREAGWRWSAVAFVYMTGLAWVGSVVTFQVASRLIGGP